MIQSFFLIDKTGVCYLSRNYADLEFDDALLGGFLAAIESLGTKLFKEEGAINEIDYGHSKFVYAVDSENELIAVAIIDKTDDSIPIKNALSELLEEFTTIFNVERLKKGDLFGIKEFYPFVDMKFQGAPIKEKKDFISKMNKLMDSF
ncbi:MAG: hypothetical protein ACFFCD_00490 [Promethearchaeota archaeon]